MTLDRAFLGAALLLPGVLTAYLGVSHGGYFPTATAIAAVEVLAAIAAHALLARRPLAGWRPRVAAAALPLAGLGGWALISQDWSHSPARAAIESDRILLYLAVLLGAAAIGYSPRRARWLAHGILGAAVAICAAALWSRLLGGHVDVGDFGRDRLSWPIGYANGLGILAGVGCLLAVHASASDDEPTWMRALGAGAVPLLAGTLLLTVSRGAVWCLVAGLVVFAVVARPRGLVGAAIAILPTTGVALLGLDHGDVVGRTPAQIQHWGLGAQPAWLIGGAIVVAVALRLAGRPLDGWLERLRLTPHARRVAAVTSIAATLLVLAAGLAAARHLQVAPQLQQAFVARSTTRAQDGAARLTDVSNNNRLSKWRVALDEFRAHPLTGAGGGTFEQSWTRERPTDGTAREAHSLYIGVLGELGLPGLVMLLSALGALGLALAVRSRGPSRAAPAALLGATVAWASHAGVDWDFHLTASSAWCFAGGGLALGRDAVTVPAVPRRVWMRAAVIAGCVLLAVVPVRLGWSQRRLDSGLAALAADDCPGASAAARGSLAAFGARAEPYQVIAFCARSAGQWRTAEDAMQRAVQRDPGDWELWYGLGVTRAAAGHDARTALATAQRLNPRGALIADQEPRLTRPSRRARERAGRDAPFALQFP